MLDASVSPMLRQDPTSVVVMGYEQVTGEAVRAVTALAEALSFAGVEVFDRLMVTATGWRHLACSCCPDEGRPLPAADHAAALELRVATGIAPAPTRADLGARLGAGPRSASVARECERIAGGGRDTVTNAALAWGRILASDTPVSALPDHVLALAAVALEADHRIELRDALLCHLCPDTLPMDALDSAIVQAVRGSIPLPWAAGEPITPEPAHRTLDRLVETCAALPDAHAVPALTVLGTFAWRCGDGSLARLALDRARTADPDYRLAQLVDRLLDLGIRPRA